MRWQCLHDATVAEVNWTSSVSKRPQPMRIDPDPDGERRAQTKRRLQKKRAPGLRLWRVLRWTVGLFVALSVGLVVACRFVNPPLTAFMAGEWLLAKATGRWDFRLSQQPVTLREIALPMRSAVVAAEDQRFMQHWGFDFVEIRAAMEEGRRDGHPARGASTITQQLAKNLFLWPGRWWIRKALEAWFTVLIEATWPKPRILEVYLNIAQFGDGVYGVEAASRLYFAATAAELSPEQAALLAAVLPNPITLQVTEPSAYLRQRQQWILNQMGL